MDGLCLCAQDVCAWVFRCVVWGRNQQCQKIITIWFPLWVGDVIGLRIICNFLVVWSINPTTVNVVDKNCCVLLLI